MLRKDMSLLDLELLELKLKLKMGEGYSKSPVQVGGHPWLHGHCCLSICVLDSACRLPCQQHAQFVLRSVCIVCCRWTCCCCHTAF
jgi:hypothetical protein